MIPKAKSGLLWVLALTEVFSIDQGYVGFRGITLSLCFWLQRMMVWGIRQEKGPVNITKY